MNMPAKGIAPQFGSAEQQDQAAMLGLWVFLATELLFFGPMFFGYVYGRTHFPDAFAAASRHTDIVLGTLNTAVLLTSSLAIAIAVAARESAERESAEREAEDKGHGSNAEEHVGNAAGNKNGTAAAYAGTTNRLAIWALAVTALLGIAFLAIKGTEYFHEWQEHLFPGPGFGMAGPHAQGGQYFFFLYFAMTGLHAVHLAIGITLVGILAIALYRNKERFASARHIRLAGLYWHFVDIVWIFLYPLLYLVGRSSA